jgi:hypothetical protein
MSKEELQSVTKMVTRQCMIRAADIIDKITENDVLTHQGAMIAAGVSLDKVHKLDRALIASAHLRAMAEELKP